MLNKRTYSYWYSNDGPGAVLLKVHSKGLDSTQLHKLASDDMPQIDIKPEKGKIFVRVITTGAVETYGPNNNADGYNLDERRVYFPSPRKGGPPSMLLDGGLNKYHNTFLQHGGVYKRHQNGRKGYESLGDIVFEWVNPKMKRGELILKLDTGLVDNGQNVWEDTVQRLAMNKPVLWSMGASVPREICSICGNVATSLDERCSCMKNNKLQVMEDGSLVFVYNDHPTCHDISEVSRPADVTAFALEKVASACQDMPYIVEEVPLSVYGEAGNRMERIKAGLLQKLADIEKKVESCDSELVSDIAPSPQREAEVVRALEGMPVNQVISTLNSQQQLLTPRTFCIIVLNRKPEELSGFNGISRILSNVFGTAMAERPSVFIEDAKYAAPEPTLVPSYASKVKGLSESLSLEPEAVKIRIVENCLRPQEREAALDEPGTEVQKVAEEYAKYQLQFLAENASDENLASVVQINTRS